LFVLIIVFISYVVFVEHYYRILSSFSPLPLLGHIWDVLLVWRKEDINKAVSVLWYCVLL